MAEALAIVGLTSAIVQFVDFSTKVVERLQDFRKKVDEVPKAFKSIHVQLPLLIDSLKQTKTQIEAGCISGDKQSNIKNVVQDCHSQLDLLYAILMKVLPQTGDNRLRRMRKALSSVRQEGQVNQITKTLAGHVQQLTYYHVSASSQPATTTAKVLFMVPFLKDECFIDREDVMKDIRQKFSVQKRVALAGIGGVGKSQIAIEYCYQYKDCHPSHSVLWAHGGTIAKFDQAYKDIARNLSLPGWDDPLADTLQLVTDWLNDESHGHWLLVLDNADDKEIFFGAGSGQQTNQATRLSQYLPISQRGAILVTTRDKRVAELICDGKTAISVPVLGPEQSAAMLQSRLSKHQWNAGDASDLLARLDNLPLAITQAAAFIKNNYISINEYLDMLRKSKSEAVDLLLEGLTDPRRDLDAPSSVIQTWKISFDQIQNKEPRAAELLSFIAVLDRQGIPKFLLSKEDESTIELTSALGTLQAFSLITAETGGTSFEMHRLVQLSTRKWLKLQGDISRWQEEALTQLSRTFPNGNYETWVMCEKLLPHAHTVLEYQMAAEPDRLAHAFLLHNMAIFELQHWHYELAFGYCDKAHAIREELLGMNHQDTLNSASTLVRILTEQEKYGEAEELNQKILEQRQSTLGMEHDDTLDSLYDLGYVLYHQEKYEEAECLHRQVLACREQRLGPQHRKSLQSMNNLALVLGDRGKYEAAEQLFRQVLQEYGEIYGLQHPRILTIMDNLAWTLRKQSKFEEAEQMLQQVVKISEKMLGPHNPKTLNSLNDLGLVLDGSGKHNAAEKMHRQVLEIRREALGPQNRDILISMHNLAIALDNQGRNEAAEQMYRQVLEVQEKRYGLEDTSTQITVYNLAFSLRRQKRFDEAETMLRQALTLAEETQGLLALRTLDVVFELAVLCNDQGDLDQAIELMQRAHDGFQKEFGVDPPGTRDSAGWLSLWVKTEKEGVKIESETGSESTADS